MEEEKEKGNGISIFILLKMLFIVLFVVYVQFFLHSRTSVRFEEINIEKGIYIILKDKNINKVYIEGFIFEDNYYIEKKENKILVFGRNINEETCVTITRRFINKKLNMKEILSICEKYMKESPNIIINMEELRPFYYKN